MGLFSAISALTAIRKLKMGKSAKLSLAQIANGLINLQDAYKKLSSEEFQRIYDLYKAFQGAKTKLELHSMDDYYLYAIDIIKKFDKIAPYELYSGGSELEFSLLMDEIRGIDLESESVELEGNPKKATNIPIISPPSLDWNLLMERSRNRLPLMYGSFLAQCQGTFANGFLTIYAPDSIIGRLDNERVKTVLQEESGAKRVILREDVMSLDEVSGMSARENREAFAEREECIDYITKNSNGMLSRQDAGRFADILLICAHQGKAKAVEAFYNFVDETISLYSDNPGLFITINGFCKGALEANGIIDQAKAQKMSTFISDRTAKWLDETRRKA